MSDSIDRVFVKAISTIRALSTRSGYGLPRPPLENRIKLYGLYKQATEGDVLGIMSRPQGSTPQDITAQRRWDAWYSQAGLSKTEAKRRYISFLIETMKTYASGTHEARELLDELIYLWDQIKDVTDDDVSASYEGVFMNYNNMGSFISTIGGGDSNNSHVGHDSHLGGSSKYGELNDYDRVRDRDLMLLKKEVNLALSKIDELNHKNSKGNNDEFWKSYDKFYILLKKVLKFGFTLFRRVVTDLVIVLLLLRILKSDTLSFSLNSNSQNDRATKLLIFLNKLNIINFHRLSIDIS